MGLLTTLVDLNEFGVNGVNFSTTISVDSRPRRLVCLAARKLGPKNQLSSGPGPKKITHPECYPFFFRTFIGVITPFIYIYIVSRGPPCMALLWLDFLLEASSDKS